VKFESELKIGKCNYSFLHSITQTILAHAGSHCVMNHTRN